MCLLSPYSVFLCVNLTTAVSDRLYGLPPGRITNRHTQSKTVTSKTIWIYQGLTTQTQIYIKVFYFWFRREFQLADKIGYTF